MANGYSHFYWCWCCFSIVLHIWVSEIMENHSGTLNILFSDEDVLLVFEWDCLNSSVYNMTENMKKMAEKIALSEGFFAGKEQINFWFVELQPVKN